MSQLRKVAVVMGSDSDLPIVRKCLKVPDQFSVSYEVRVISAHRTPEAAMELARGAREAGFGVIIGAAGMAAHLAGVLAAYTTLPVIGLPCKGPSLEGLDALLAMVQMPKGVPVATVAIDGGDNAAYLAIQMLAISDPELARKLDEKKAAMAQEVMDKDKKLQKEIMG